MVSAPSTNRDESEVRDSAGRFKVGNPGGPGNPHAAKVQRLREVFFAEVNPEKFAEVVRACLRDAIGTEKGGDVTAQGKIIAYAIGKEEAADLSEKLEQLESLLRAARAAPLARVA